MKDQTLPAFALLAALLFPAAVGAQTDEPTAEVESKTSTNPSAAEVAAPADVFHLPRTDAAGGKNAELYAVLGSDWKFEEVVLEYRRLDSPESSFVAVPFRRASSTDFVAVIPGSDMQPPGVEYYIHGRSDAGDKNHYASPEKPHQIVVLGETEHTRQTARLARHGGKRSEFALYGEYSLFGTRAYATEGDRAIEETTSGSDWYWGSSLEYTYRFLSTLYAINFGVGVLRGHQDTLNRDGAEERATPIDGLGPNDEPGMNYGWGQLTLEANKLFSVDMKLLLGASAVGFAAGIGGTARIGEIGQTRLELGGEVFQDIGNVGFMFFHWDTVPRVPMALGIELTSRPNPAAPGGSRVIYDIGFEFSESLSVAARVGSIIRTGGTSSGWMGGLRTSYAF